MAIGAFLCHTITGRHRCCYMKGMYGGNYRMKACGQQKNWSEHNFRQGKQACGRQKDFCGNKTGMGMCKPGCACPMCSKKAASLSDPNKAACPMMDKKTNEVGKD